MSSISRWQPIFLSARYSYLLESYFLCRGDDLLHRFRTQLATLFVFDNYRPSMGCFSNLIIYIVLVLI